MKRQRQRTTVLPLSVALQSTGVDDAETLKRTIYTRWKKQHVTHVLLIGEADRMPVRFMVLDRKTPAAFNYAFYPGDLYYADLAKADGSFEDWNAQHNAFHARYFGEVRGEHIKSDPINFDQNDYLPDVAVGRWPVANRDQLQHIATTTIAHEASLHGKKQERLESLKPNDGWYPPSIFFQAMNFMLFADPTRPLPHAER